MNSEQTNEIAAALAKAQGMMENAKFNKVNPHFKNKYADLAAVIDAIRKPFADNGISYSQITRLDEGNSFMLITKLLHSSGQYIQSEYPLPFVPDKPQVLGSAMTYARRYELAAISGVASQEDDDAEAAAAVTPQAYKPKQPATDIIKAPHDPNTGEVATDGPDPIQNKARQMAKRGRAEFYDHYKSSNEEERAKIDLIIDELRETVEALEAAAEGQGS